MKKLFAFAVCALLAISARAQSPAKELTPQQRLMQTCNAEAKGLKGDEFEKGRHTCLSDGKERQQGVMKACAA